MIFTQNLLWYWKQISTSVYTSVKDNFMIFRHEFLTHFPDFIASIQFNVLWFYSCWKSDVILFENGIRKYCENVVKN